jgi:hypothetical protein
MVLCLKETFIVSPANLVEPMIGFASQCLHLFVCRDCIV